jgi:hypothetical protein
MDQLSFTPEDTPIEVISTARGCPEACSSCGFYLDRNVLRKQAVEIYEDEDQDAPATLDKIESWVKKALRSQMETRPVPTPLLHSFLQRAHDLGLKFSDIVTTDVNVEPLRVDSTAELARGIYDVSQGESQLAVITHGLKLRKNGEVPGRMARRMQEVVDAAREGIIPLIVVTLDFARSQGALSNEYTLACYQSTFEALAAARDHCRITVSVQGESQSLCGHTLYPTPPLHISRSNWAYHEIIQTPGLEWVAEITRDTRVYVPLGRASQLDGLEDDSTCDVIPDPAFVQARDLHRWPNRAKIGPYGDIYAQQRRPGATYNDTVNPQAWDLWHPHA